MRIGSKALAVAVGAFMTVGAVSAPAHAQGEGDSARGTIKIEETEFRDQGDVPNEVKVGCDFSVDFFGMDEGVVPVTFTLMPPSGSDVIFRDEARVEAAQGNELSGRLDVDLTDELASVAPAQAEDFDYKVRVDAEVKESEGNDSITKTAIAFIVCDTSGAGRGGDVPVGGVAAGGGGTADDGSAITVPAAIGAGAILLGFLALRRRARAGA